MPETPAKIGPRKVREKVRARTRTVITTPGDLPNVSLPDAETIAYAAGVAALAAVEIIEWPVGLALIGAHLIVRRRNKGKVEQAIADAFETAAGERP